MFVGIQNAKILQVYYFKLVNSAISFLAMES